jgi:hypothetical protein
MNRCKLLVLASCTTGLSPVAFSSAVTAQARQCSTERPPNARLHWSYRIIDGRKCWYEGKPMLSNSLLHWPPALTVKGDPEQEPNFLQTNSYNFLDAQAFMPNDSDSFEARWRQRFLEAIGK